MKSRFLDKVLEIVNKKQKVDFREVIDDKIPENICIIQGKIYERKFIHSFEIKFNKTTYKDIKKYANALIEVIKNDKINFKK